jgi:hypothetical protein
MDDRTLWLQVAGLLKATARAQVEPEPKRIEVTRRSLLAIASLLEKRYTGNSEPEPSRSGEPAEVKPRYIGA